MVMMAVNLGRKGYCVETAVREVLDIEKCSQNVWSKKVVLRGQLPPLEQSCHPKIATFSLCVLDFGRQ